MKKDGIYTMLLGLVITIFTAFLFFSKNNEVLMNAFVITIYKTHHFNWAPMIGISIMAFGEYLLWESQSNNNLKEVMIKLMNKFHSRVSDLRLSLKFVSNNNLINYKVFKMILLILKF